MCAQQKLKSAWASAQSDHSIRCPHEERLGPQWVAKDPSFLHANSKDSDQTGRMPGRTYHFVGFVMGQLIFKR